MLFKTRSRHSARPAWHANFQPEPGWPGKTQPDWAEKVEHGLARFSQILFFTLLCLYPRSQPQNFSYLDESAAGKISPVWLNLKNDFRSDFSSNPSTKLSKSPLNSFSKLRNNKICFCPFKSAVSCFETDLIWLFSSRLDKIQPKSISSKVMKAAWLSFVF